MSIYSTSSPPKKKNTLGVLETQEINRYQKRTKQNTLEKHNLITKQLFVWCPNVTFLGNIQVSGRTLDPLGQVARD